MIDAKMWGSKSNKQCDCTKMVKKCAGELNSKLRLSRRPLREEEEMNKAFGKELKAKVLLFDRQAATAAEERRDEAVRRVLESEPYAAPSSTSRLWSEMICKDDDKNGVVVGVVTVEARITAGPASSSLDRASWTELERKAKCQLRIG